MEVRLHATPLCDSVFRFDDEMLVCPHLQGRAGPESPVLYLRRSSEDGLFAVFASHFDAVWASAMQVGNRPSPSQ